MISRRMFLKAAGACAAGVLAAPLAACSRLDAAVAPALVPGAQPARRAAFLFDTAIAIEAFCDEDLLDRVMDRLQYFEDIFSRTKAGSDVFAINHADGMPVTVHEETADVLAKALGYSAASQGMFDVTIGSVTELWDFKKGISPDQDALEAALPHVDWRTVGIDGLTVTLTDPDAKIDLGAIAKGYATDDIVGMLVRGGCESALVNMGGNAFALGSKPSGDPWSIGIQDPNSVRGTVLATIPAANLSAVTSGINERSFEENGVLRHHILDPHTGMPFETELASATILSGKSVDGDACSTIAFLLGADLGERFAREHAGASALFVDRNGRSSASRGLEVSWA
ncbi:FAD:protein FMN transferase [Berryella intestinalis]|uniref:FAD:protein FMN transferase n=1 Tax=Berryella intestinalis TaxID=1531429 RepID=UPI001184DBCB|nr:FAD:protein FMN transferase [Berryella intestinalis]